MTEEIRDGPDAKERGAQFTCHSSASPSQTGDLQPAYLNDNADYRGMQCSGNRRPGNPSCKTRRRQPRQRPEWTPPSHSSPAVQGPLLDDTGWFKVEPFHVRLFTVSGNNWEATRLWVERILRSARHSHTGDDHNTTENLSGVREPRRPRKPTQPDRTATAEPQPDQVIHETVRA